MKEFDNAAKMLCPEISGVLLKIAENKKRSIQEIRLRSGKPVALSSGTETLYVCGDGAIVYSPERAFRCTRRHIYDTFRQLCDYSLYSRQDEIKNGFITVKGGHRVGLCGTAALKDGQISAVTDITSLNVRISRRLYGISEPLLSKLLPLTGGFLIVGAPSTGKTTLLRDIAFRISGGVNCRAMRTSVIDERGEISGGFSEESGHDLGLSDVLRGYPKSEGIMQAIRSLSPQVIICDEVGNADDCRGIAEGANAGAYMIGTIHAPSWDDLMKRRQAKELLGTGAFSHAVILSSSDKPGEVREIREV